MDTQTLFDWFLMLAYTNEEKKLFYFFLEFRFFFHLNPFYQINIKQKKRNENKKSFQNFWFSGNREVLFFFSFLMRAAPEQAFFYFLLFPNKPIFLVFPTDKLFFLIQQRKKKKEYRPVRPFWVLKSGSHSHPKVKSM